MSVGISGTHGQTRQLAEAVGAAISVCAECSTGVGFEQRELVARWTFAHACAASVLRNVGLHTCLPAFPAGLEAVIQEPETEHARELVRACATLALRTYSDALGVRAIGHALGDIHQRSLEWKCGEDGRWIPAGRYGRAIRGAYYTPPELVDRVLALAWRSIEAHPDYPVRVCDPACGSANFLTACLQQGRHRGLNVRVEGADIDPIAAWMANTALKACSEAGSDVPGTGCVRTGDGLIGSLPGLPDGARPDSTNGSPLDWPQAFDLVVGNPPFLGQLGLTTARSRESAAYLRRESSGVVAGYADTAAAFLWRSVMLAKPGGVIGLIMPRSFLRARDAAAVRSFVASSCESIATEMIDDPSFDAGVAPCILVMRRTADDDKQRPRRASASVVEVAEASRPPTLSLICEATADFRDEYYGLQPFVIDDLHGNMDDVRFPRVITCGMIEPGVSLWGIRPSRLYKRLWQRPRVDLSALTRDSRMQAWAQRRLVPKVLVATQTRSIESVADPNGQWLPVTPVISVTPRPGISVDQVQRALRSETASDFARRAAFGTGLSPGVFRLSAAQIGVLPLESTRSDLLSDAASALDSQ